jgi:hypothetical protein
MHQAELTVYKIRKDISVTETEADVTATKTGFTDSNVQQPKTVILSAWRSVHFSGNFQKFKHKHGFFRILATTDVTGLAYTPVNTSE